MDNEVIGVFINDTKKDLNELFDRIRKMEVHQAVAIERDKALLDKMDELTVFFKSHDEAEMKKYDSIESEVTKLTQMFYIASGVSLLLGYIGIDNLKLLLGG